MASGHQITITPIDQHVEVTLGGEKLASSDRALLLRETGSPDRYYLPADDVRTELLKPTSTTSTCPFKGEAAYWSVEAGGEVHQDVVWSYPVAGNLALSRNGFYQPTDDTGFETPLAAPPKAIVVTTWGIWRGEGMGLVEAIN